MLHKDYHKWKREKDGEEPIEALASPPQTDMDSCYYPGRPTDLADSASLASCPMSRYEGTDFQKHCLPCFLVARPGSSAKRLVVHYAKLNERLKRHSGSIPNLERAIERAARTEYKTKLDKLSGFWQIDLTERSKELSAVIAPNGQVFRWNVMPFGLANAPATFQELMNQIIAIMKRRPKFQQHLRKGAVIEAYIDDVFLGTNTTEDHKALIDEFPSVCDECNTRVKLEKCGFMKEVVEYLGSR